jgi:hypothetical protein
LVSPSDNFVEREKAFIVNGKENGEDRRKYDGEHLLRERRMATSKRQCNNNAQRQKMVSIHGESQCRMALQLSPSWLGLGSDKSEASPPQMIVKVRRKYDGTTSKEGVDPWRTPMSSGSPRIMISPSWSSGSENSEASPPQKIVKMRREYDGTTSKDGVDPSIIPKSNETPRIMISPTSKDGVNPSRIPMSNGTPRIMISPSWSLGSEKSGASPPQKIVKMRRGEEYVIEVPRAATNASTTKGIISNSKLPDVLLDKTRSAKNHIKTERRNSVDESVDESIKTETQASKNSVSLNSLLQSHPDSSRRSTRMTSKVSPTSSSKDCESQKRPSSNRNDRRTSQASKATSSELSESSKKNHYIRTSQTKTPKKNSSSSRSRHRRSRATFFLVSDQLNSFTSFTKNPRGASTRSPESDEQEEPPKKLSNIPTAFRNSFSKKAQHFSRSSGYSIGSDSLAAPYSPARDGSIPPAFLSSCYESPFSKSPRFFRRSLQIGATCTTLTPSVKSKGSLAQNSLVGTTNGQARTSMIPKRNSLKPGKFERNPSFNGIPALYL